MKHLSYFINLFIIFILCNIILYFLSVNSVYDLPFYNLAWITSGSFFISAIILIIFIRGLAKEGKISIVYTFAVVSLKFILYLILILIYYFLVKKLNLEFIVTFFIIYLSFTSYLMFSFMNLLKNSKPKR